MRIAIVNDTLMSVIALRNIVESQEQYSIAWVAHNGEEAIKLCADDIPDLILMDIIMPVVDGVEATQKIMINSPCAILLVTSSVDGNASKVFEAMGAGAIDAINTPIIDSSSGKTTDNMLLNKISMIGKLIKYSNTKVSTNKNQTIKRTIHKKNTLIAIGSSTGGPTALVKVLGNIQDDISASIIIIQHVDKQFIEGFIKWINDQVTLPVRMAKSGDVLTAGTILISDSAKHLMISSDNTLTYTKEPENYPYIPSVNVFFESVAKNWNGESMGILLTGMGRDGAKGLLEMKNKGFTTIAQEESSCAVYGMPKAAVDLNAADLILSPIEIHEKIVQSFTCTSNTNIEYDKYAE